MNWFKRLLGRTETSEPQRKESAAATTAAPVAASAMEGLEGIRFGRYSDNNKALKKTQAWYEAEEKFKVKAYTESFGALFNYLRDDAEDNVHFHLEGHNFTFDLEQGSRRIYGSSDGKNITASVSLAHMGQQSTAVMRRLLELNYSLYYGRCALDDDNNLHMLFDTDVASANPSKLYYGLRELAIKADRQDDLLLADFPTLKAIDNGHIQPLPKHELEVKYKYFRKWIEEALKRTGELNQDSFSGAIAYLMLTCVYRIDFLLTPEAKLLLELERVSDIYWLKKDEMPLVERNYLMKEALQKLLDWTLEEFATCVYRSRSTFAIATPPKTDKMRDNVINSNKDSRWYIENKYRDLAMVLNEYGLLYNHFLFSMPKVLTDLTTVYMAVLHADFFAELGMKNRLYDADKNKFDRDAIQKGIDDAVVRFKDKYPSMQWSHSRVSYHSLYDFGVTFAELAANLNLETKR